VPKQKTTATKAPAGTRPKDQGGVYGDYSARDELVWKSETEKFVADGNAIFHDPKKLGGTVGISCDMCHPNASNTHPETYPKYQVQLQRVALLRDMINWCLENPVKAQALPDDSVKMRALEAYIIAQRKGQKLDFGKH
jgi:cytochrome c